MKKFLLAGIVVLLAVGCAEKVNASDMYVQGGLGMTKYDFSGATDDQQGTNYFGAFGYIFDNNLGLEGEYEYVDNAKLASGVKVSEQQNINLYGVGRLPIDNEDKVNLIAKAGFGYGKTKIEGDSDRNWYPAFGAGVEWRITDSWGAVALIDYKSYDFSTGGNDTSADPISYKAGVQYRF